MTTLYDFVDNDKPPPKGSNFLEKIGLETMFKPSILLPAERMWEGAKRVYGEVENMPEELPLIIWGAEVVDARQLADCPLCGWAGDIFLLCAYHKYRQCECGSILGINQCKCEEEN